MATQYSDIYIDGITTEELYADGGQIVEAWLNGECIWKLIDKLEYWKQIYVWTRYNGINYGFGRYATSDSSNPKYDFVYFYGADVGNMFFSKIHDREATGFSDGVNTSAYDFGLCRFSSSTIGALSFDVKSTGSLNIKEFSEEPKPVNEFLGEEFINISEPLGASCNVFSYRYHIYSRDYKTGNYTTGAAIIKDVINNTEKIIAFSTPIKGDYFALGPCACFKGKIYFPGRKISYSYEYDITSILPLFYINENNELSYIELESPSFLFAHVGGVDANKSRMIWTLHTYLRIGSQNITENTYLYEYDGINAKYSLIYEQRYISGAKIVGQYIILYGFKEFYINNSLTSYNMYVGKTIYDMKLFIFNSQDYGLRYGKAYSNTKNSARPRVFYEENGELFFDIIFTEEKAIIASYVYTGNSYVLKMKPNFDTGKIEEVSRTEINGKWEE